MSQISKRSMLLAGSAAADHHVSRAQPCRACIPHRKDAIEMTRSELEHGKDPQLRQMAQKIIKAQEREIATLKDWLAQHQK